MYRYLTVLEQQIDRICHMSFAVTLSGTVIGLPKRTTSPSNTQKTPNLEPPLVSLEPPSVPQLHPQINKSSDKHKITSLPLEEIRQPLHQNRKRQHNENSTDRQTFLHEQISMQNRTLQIMSKQGEAAEEQAKALKEIAHTTAAIWQSLTELTKYLKDEN